MNFVSMFFSAISLLGQPSELSKRYTTTIYDVEQLAITGRKVQRRCDTSIPYSPKNDLDVYKLSAQLTIINRDNFRSIGEVEGKIRQLEYEVEKARQELNALAAQQDTHSQTLPSKLRNIFLCWTRQSELPLRNSA